MASPRAAGDRWAFVGWGRCELLRAFGSYGAAGSCCLLLRVIGGAFVGGVAASSWELLGVMELLGAVGWY